LTGWVIGRGSLLVELDRVGDRPRVALELAGLAEQLDDASLRLLDRLARELGVCGLARRGRDPVGDVLLQPAVPLEDGPRGQLQLAPPRDVGRVTERADHGDTGALVRLCELVGDDR
jgi:hypothetical protein